MEGRAVTGSDTLALEVCSLGPADSNDQLLAIGQFEVTLGPSPPTPATSTPLMKTEVRWAP